MFFFPFLFPSCCHSFVYRVVRIIIIILLRVFPSCISWWFSIEVWVTTSLLKSPGLFLVFCLIYNAVVWMVSTCPLIFRSSSLSANRLMTVVSAPITIDITVTFMFHSLFGSLARSWYLSLFSLSFSFTLWSTGTAKSSIRQVLFFVNYL